MSIILDALRRAERERNLGQAPRLEDVALAPGTVTPVPRRRLPWLLIASVVVLAAVTVAAFLLRRPPAGAPVAAQAPAPAPVPAPAATNATPPPAPASAAAPPPAAPTVAAIEEGPPAISEDADLASLDDLAAPGNPAAAEAPAQEPEFIREAQPEPETPRLPQAAEELAPPQPQVSRLQLDPAPVPALRRLQDMPAAYRADFPALTLDVHVWDDDPARRFVLVDGRRYREGEALAAGPRIVEIAPEGLVLDYRGERLLYALER